MPSAARIRLFSAVLAACLLAAPQPSCSGFFSGFGERIEQGRNEGKAKGEKLCGKICGVVGGFLGALGELFGGGHDDNDQGRGRRGHGGDSHNVDNVDNGHSGDSSVSNSPEPSSSPLSAPSSPSPAGRSPVVAAAGEEMTEDEFAAAVAAHKAQAGNVESLKTVSEQRHSRVDIPDIPAGGWVRERRPASANGLQLASAQLAPRLLGTSHAGDPGPGQIHRYDENPAASNPTDPLTLSRRAATRRLVGRTAAEGRLALAQGTRSSGDYEAMLEAALMAIRADPNDARGHVAKAQSLVHLGRNAEAELAAWKAIDLNPRDPVAFEAMGLAQFKQNKLAQAVESFSRAISLDPVNPQPYAARAMVYEAMGERRKMINDLRMAAGLDPAFRRHLGPAEAGKRVFDPNVADAYRLLAPLPDEEKRGSNIPWGLGGLLALAGLGFFAYRRWGRRSASEGAVETAALAPTPISSAAPGALAGKYELGREILPKVFEAKDRSLHRDVMVRKVAGGIERRASLTEAQKLAAMHHPNILEVLDVVEDPEGLYLVLERIEGKTAERLLADRRTIPLAEARKIIEGAGAALGQAHAQGVVHRDLRPVHILLDARGFVKLMGFGLADSDGKLPPQQMGYRAPETANAPGGPASDIFSLGVALYELVTGRLPFRSTIGAAGEYVPATLSVPGLPREFDDLIRRAIKIDPAERFSSAAEFVSALQKLPEGRSFDT